MRFKRITALAQIGSALMAALAAAPVGYTTAAEGPWPKGTG
jgi:hypothetical protein